MNCPECGNTVLKTDQFCSKCYARLEPPGLWRKLLSLFQPVVKSKAHILGNQTTVTRETADLDRTRHEYHSLDEVPPETNATTEKLEADMAKNEADLSAETVEESQGARRIISQKSFVVYQIKDATGQERIYHSLDEVPWEKRSQIEKLGSEAMKEANLLASKTFDQAKEASGIIGRKSITVYKVKDASGQERIYHSLEELPPEIREMLEGLQK